MESGAVEGAVCERSPVLAPPRVDGNPRPRYLSVLLVQRDVAQSGSAPGLGPGGRQFESGRPDFPPMNVQCGGAAGASLWAGRQ